MAYKKRINFLESEEGLLAKELLQEMAEDKAYNTSPGYSANSDLYPSGVVPFVDKHMDYLSTHPNTEPQAYISNLRLMTRIRV